MREGRGGIPWAVVSRERTWRLKRRFGRSASKPHEKMQEEDVRAGCQSSVPEGYETDFRQRCDKSSTMQDMVLERDMKWNFISKQ